MEKFKKGVLGIPYQYRHYKLCYLLFHKKRLPPGWEFPKGGLNGKTKGQAIKEELKEEANIRISKPKPLIYRGEHYNYEYYFYEESGDLIRRLMYVYYVHVNKSEEIRVDDREHDYFGWMTRKRALDFLRHKNMVKSLIITERVIKGRAHRY